MLYVFIYLFIYLCKCLSTNLYLNKEVADPSETISKARFLLTQPIVVRNTAKVNLLHKLGLLHRVDNKNLALCMLDKSNDNNDRK